MFDNLLTRVQPPPVVSSPVSSTAAVGGTGYVPQQDPLMSTDYDNSITMSSSTPIITSRDIVESPVPIQTEAQIWAPTPVPKIVITDSSSLAPIEMANEVVITSIDTLPLIPEVTPTDTISNDIVASESDISFPLFDMIADPTPAAIVMNEITINEPKSIPENTHWPIFRDTAEYIDHAIIEVGRLMVALDAANDAKLVERDEYKTQKEQFAELEQSAESEHQKMLIERAHAKKMETYLKHEREKTTWAENDDRFAIAA